MGSSPRRKNFLLGIAHPVVGKPFQVLEVHREMRLTQDLSCEEKKLEMPCFVFCDFWVGNPGFCNIWNKCVVFNLVLYN